MGAGPQISFAILKNGQKVFIRKPLRNRVMSEGRTVISGYAIVSSKPHVSVFVLHNGPYTIARQTFFSGVMRNVYSVKFIHTPILGTDPEITLIIFKDAVNQIRA